MGWAGDGTLPGTLHDVCRGDIPRRVRRTILARDARDVAATPEASQSQVHDEECEGRVACLRNPVLNGIRPGQRPQFIVRAHRTQSAAILWRLSAACRGRAGRGRASAPLLLLPPVMGDPPVMPSPAHGGQTSRCRSRRRVRAAGLLLNRASTSRRTPAGLPSSTCPPLAATGYRPPKRSRPERGRGRKTRHPAQPWVPSGSTVRIE